jgi:histidine phosphotransferase ChpT
MTSVDTRVLELLASKICHDLISPVGAVSNGVEILEEMGADAGEEVTGLIAYSANQAASKLKAMRLAYGLGGADTSILPKDVHAAFGNYLGSDSRIKQDWSPEKISTPVNGAPKLLMCALILAAETLPKGGKITVEQETPSTILISAAGENAHFRDGIPAALLLSLPPDKIEPVQVHAYMTGLQARNYNTSLSTENSGTNFIHLRLNFSGVSCL